MPVNGVATQEMSIKDTAVLFSERDVHLIDWFEGEQGPVAMIRFHGGDDAGPQALEVAKELGLIPEELHRVWDQTHDEIKDSPYWMLTFFYQQ